MTDKRKAPDAPEGRRKRAAPTIDLTATEVPPQEDAAPAEPAQAEQAGHEEPPAAVQEPAHEPPPEPAHRAFGGIASIVAGFAGAIVAIALLAALWAAGVLPVASNGKDQSAEIAALQSQVQALQSRPAAPAADNKAVDALRQTVRKLESDITKLPRGDATMAARLKAIDNAMNALSVSIGLLTKRGDDIAAKAEQAQQSAAKAEKAVADLHDSVQNAAKAATAAVEPGALDALQKQVAALGQSLKTTRDEIAKQLANASATDKPARLALSAVALRAAVAGGKPYPSRARASQIARRRRQGAGAARAIRFRRPAEQGFTRARIARADAGHAESLRRAQAAGRLPRAPAGQCQQDRAHQPGQCAEGGHVRRPAGAPGNRRRA